MNQKEIELIIPISEKDIPILKRNLPYFFKNLLVSEIVVIGNDIVGNAFKEIKKVKYINEDTLYEGMSFLKIKEIISSINKKGIKRTGWYFQQFIKFAYSFNTKSSCYLVWDSDTIPLNKIEFIDKETGKYLFNIKEEYNKLYFNTLSKLFFPKIDKVIKESFITEHMIFDTKIVKELILKIEENNDIEGQTFYEKILKTIDKESLALSGFSEFETYGTYIYTYYNDMVKFRRLRSMRHGKIYFGDNFTQNHLIWAAKEYDTISFEAFEKESLLSFIWKNSYVINNIKLSKVDNFINPGIIIYHKFRRICKNILKK